MDDLASPRSTAALNDGGDFEAVLLAAGRGTRLWPLTRHTPKILLDLGDGTSLLERQLRTFDGADSVRHATVVVGHLAGKVEARIAEEWEGVASARFNPFYLDNGPIGSLWAVRDQLRDRDVLVMNGDTLYRPSVIRTAIEAIGSPAGGIGLIVSAVDTTNPDDVRVRLDPGGRVTGVGKELDVSGHRSAGLLIVRGSRHRTALVAALDELVRDPNSLRPDAPWHELVNSLVAAGTPVQGVMVDDGAWAEVDLHPDISTLHSMMADYLSE